MLEHGFLVCAMPALGDGGEIKLACPVCGDPYVRPVSLSCLPPGRDRGLLVVNAAGVYLDPSCPPSERGVLIELSFYCEQGHTFGYRFHFHKGHTLLRQHAEKAPAQGATIWRD